jgi:L-threo-3-deoxy-hexylosonate aldolase
MIYNFPAVTGGIDLDDRLLASIAAKAPNTCGVKLTCANVGKMTRLAAATKAPQFLQQHPRTNKKAPYVIM